MRNTLFITFFIRNCSVRKDTRYFFVKEKKLRFHDKNLYQFAYKSIFPYKHLKYLNIYKINSNVSQKSSPRGLIQRYTVEYLLEVPSSSGSFHRVWEGEKYRGTIDGERRRSSLSRERRRNSGSPEVKRRSRTAAAALKALFAANVPWRRTTVRHRSSLRCPPLNKFTFAREINARQWPKPLRIPFAGILEKSRARCIFLGATLLYVLLG